MLVTAKTEHIQINQLAPMGVEIICPSIWKSLGFDFNPAPLSAKVIQRIKALPQDLSLLAAVPIKGGITALEFGNKANEYANKIGILKALPGPAVPCQEIIQAILE